LKSICEQVLISQIDATSVTTLLDLADRHNVTHLKRKCIAYINANSAEVKQTSTWKQMCERRPELIVELYNDLSGKIEEHS